MVERGGKELLINLRKTVPILKRSRGRIVATIHLTFSQGGSIVYSRGTAFPLTEVSYSPAFANNTMMEKK